MSSDGKWKVLNGAAEGVKTEWRLSKGSPFRQYRHTVELPSAVLDKSKGNFGCLVTPSARDWFKAAADSVGTTDFFGFGECVCVPPA